MPRGVSNQPRRAWCEPEEQRFADMVLAGVSYRDIGAALGRTPHAVRVRAHQMGVKAPADAVGRRIKDGLKARWRDEVFRRKVAEGAARAWTDERRAAASNRLTECKFWESGLKVLRDDPGAQDRRKRAAAETGRKNGERILAWCPPERRDEYRAIAKKMKAADARALMEEMFAREEAAWNRDALAGKPKRTFAEMLAYVEAGGKLVERVPLRKPPSDYSETGCALA